jgi:glycosyltransferase involved in cell wall biosynthesis
VHLPGFKQYEELPAWYAAAGAFVHASTSEQWGLVVNEAMAAGLPVLVSNRCGCAPELVREGVNGFTFNPNDEEALANHLLHVSSMSPGARKEMGRASQQIITSLAPEQFGKGLLAAAQQAVKSGVPHMGMLNRLLLRQLAQR